MAPLAALLVAALALTGCDQSSAPTGASSANPDQPSALPDTPNDRGEKNLVQADDTPDQPDLIAGQYIVVYKGGLSKGRVQSTTTALAQRADVSVARTYETALHGFSGELSPKAADDLKKDPRVAYVEQDRYVHIVASESNATWGLDRVDQRGSSLDNEYTYNDTGQGVTAYIIDTGINTSHNDFEGRASVGFDALGGNGQDQNGHGTHVSGTVGGETYGVAKDVNLVAVRVLNASGRGSISGVIDGVDYVANNAGGPSVANMSLGGGASQALDDAVQNAIDQGVTFAVAAGNSDANACNSSPSRVGDALTVGATTSSDNRASYSNYGNCVDLFAPGSNITSDWYTSDTATNTISGTSMASPHVAGVAALYLEDHNGASPSAVFSAVTDAATSGAVSGTNGSPNLLLYSLVNGGGDDGGDDGGGGGGGGGDDGGGNAPCTACTLYGGSLSGSGDEAFQPDGNYYSSGSGTQRGYLRGPSSADFDLYLWKYSYFGWQVVASSTSPSSSEDITYNGSSGYYTWRVYSYSGSGSYDFYLNRP